MENKQFVEFDGKKVLVSWRLFCYMEDDLLWAQGRCFLADAGELMALQKINTVVNGGYILLGKKGGWQ